MGCCLSKTTPSSTPPCVLPSPSDLTRSKTEPEKKKTEEEETVKKEIFIIKHRRSHDIDKRSEDEKGKTDQRLTSPTTPVSSTTSEPADLGGGGGGTSSSVVAANRGGLSNGGAVVRTSSCTKEEVDAILIQCGRLSRSSSTGKAASSGSGGRKYSGSKRSYDFDSETAKGNAVEDKSDDGNVGGDDVAVAAERIHRHRQRQRQSPSSPSSSSKGRRRTPSRERDQQQQQQRSGSRERGGSSGGGRRVSRSPGRRSDSPITNSNASSNRPGKMVSVPATVSSMANGTEAPPPTSGSAIRRISVKRNAGESAMAGSRSIASPRSRSPARANQNVRANNENQNGHCNQQQPLSLSRSNSRKAEQSPYRRTPLGEIDQNSLGFDPLALPNNKTSSTNNNGLSQKPNVENANNNKVAQATVNKTSSGKGALENKVITINSRAKEQNEMIVEEAKGSQQMTRDITVTEVASESLKLQSLTRSRSSRRSRDLDINPEALLNPNPSYTTLLLEDIQNFHQKNTTTTTTPFSLPACLTKANSILEAVADLNSSTSSSLSSAFSDDRRCPVAEQFNKMRIEIKDPILESEVGVTDDLMEPSLHKYVTVRRNTIGGTDMEEEESSGSNSFVGGQQHWVASASWEPNSADSTDCSTSSRFVAREDDRSPQGVQRLAFSEDATQRRLTRKQQSGIGRGKVGSVRGLSTLPTTAAASTGSHVH